MSHFLAYQRKINGSNAAIETSFISKCARANVNVPSVEKPLSHRPQKQAKTTKPEMTNKEITSLAKRIENKPASEIIEILREEFRPKIAHAPVTDSQFTEKAVEPPAPTKAKPFPHRPPQYRPVPHYKANGPTPHGPFRQYAPPHHRPIWAHEYRGRHGPAPHTRMQVRPPRHFGFPPPYGGPYRYPY